MIVTSQFASIRGNKADKPTTTTTIFTIPQQNVALVEASKQLEKHLSNDNEYIDLSQQLNTSSNGISGIGENDYVSLSTLPGFQNLPNFSSVRRVPLPVELVEQFSHLQYNCLMGLFPEIKRAWLSVDSDIFVWNYEDGSDVAYFDGLSEYIISAGLVRPKAGIFQDHIKFLLCLATTVDVVLLGVSFAEPTLDADYPYKEMHLLPQPLFVVPLDQQTEINSIRGTNNGRIFMTSKNCCLYEIVYLEKAGWFTHQCRIVNHTSSYLSSLVNVLLKTVNIFSTEDSLQQLVIDESRNILYTLSKESAIQVFDLGSDGNSISHFVTFHRSNIISQASKSARYIDSGNFAPIVSIAPIKQQESLNIQLIAITKSGVRLYFSIADGTSRPHKFQLVHIRMPPGCTPSVPAMQRPTNINLAYYNRGVMFMTSSNSDDNDLLWYTNPELFPFMKVHKESQSTTSLNGHTWAIDETKGYERVANVKETVLKSDPPAIVSQHATSTRQFVVLGAQGTYLFDNYRPVDLLRHVLSKCGRVDQDAIQTFFNLYALNAFASSLVLACSNRPVDQHVGKLAAEAFFHYSDDARFDFPSGSLNPQPAISPQSGTVQSFPQSGAVQSFPQSATIQSFSQSSGVKSFSQSGAVQSFPQSGAVQSFPQSGAVQSFPQSGAVQPFQQPGAVQSFPQPPASNPSSHATLDGSYLSLGRRPNPIDINRPLQSEKPPQDSVITGVPTMKYSLKHDGLYLYLARILRPVWNITLVLEPGDTKRPESQYSFEELLWLCEQVASLKAFVEEHNQLFPTLNTEGSSFLNPSLHHHMLNVVKSQGGLPADSIAPHEQLMHSQLHQRYKADATATEKRSLDYLKSLLTRCIECFSLWGIVCDHGFSTVANMLRKDIQETVVTMKFKDFVLGDGKISNAMIASLIDMYLSDNASTDSITDKLREQCPSLYSNEDAICSKAYEMLHNAKLTVDMKEAEKAYRLSLKLFRQVTKQIDVAAVCRQYEEVFFYEGVVELALTAAHNEDPKGYALNFYKNGEPPNDNIGKEAFTKRGLCYKCITISLDYLIRTAATEASRSPLSSVVAGVSRWKTDNLAVHEAETMMAKILDQAFGSGDELVHVTLYDWLITNNLYDRLLAVSSVHLETYLKRAQTVLPSNLVAMDLLWKYYEKNNKYQSAAMVLSKLAARTSTDVTLHSRVEYLSRAIISAKSASFPASGERDGDFLHELEEKLEVAVIQKKIHDAIAILQQEKGHSDGYTEALRILNGGIFDISTLYKEYACKFELAECKLAILYTAGMNDIRLIESVWKDIIDYEIDRSSNLSDGAKMTTISNRLVAIGSAYSHSEHYFPLLYILTLLEKRSCELNWDNKLVFETLLRVSVSRRTLQLAYDTLFRAKDPFWQAVKVPLHLLVVIFAFITSSINATDFSPEDRHEFCIGALDSIENYLIELESMSSSSQVVRTMIGNYRSLQAQLSRLI